MNPEIKLTNSFHNLLIEDAFINYCIGGRFSGKTHNILLIIIIFSIHYKGYQTAIFRKFFSSIKKSVYKDLVAILSKLDFLQGQYIVGKAPLSIRFNNGSEIFFLGLDDIEKSKGLNVHCGFMEELTEFNKMDLETVLLSLRGEDYPHKLFMAHNPIPITGSFKPWFKERFGNKDLPLGKIIIREDIELGKVASLKTTFQNNPFIPESSMRILNGYKKSNPTLYKQWALGEYSQLEGLAFPNFKIVKEVPPELLNDSSKCIYGMDHGWNDPQTVVKIWFSMSDIYIQEVVYGSHLPLEEVAKQVLDYGYKGYETITADSAEPKSNAHLRTLGLSGIRPVKKTAGFKADMVKILNGFNLYIIEGSDNVIAEFSSWSWKKDPKSDKQLDALEDGGDHTCDAFIYGMTTRVKYLSNVKK